jgi:hypothetical protein
VGEVWKIPVTGRGTASTAQQMRANAESELSQNNNGNLGFLLHGNWHQATCLYKFCSAARASGRHYTPA